MNHHLCEISSRVAADAHAVVILDGASWQKSQGLVARPRPDPLALRGRLGSGLARSIAGAGYVA
jgi:hypothetical protein